MADDEFVRVFPKGLSKFLALNYPGAKSVTEAVRIHAGRAKGVTGPAPVRQVCLAEEYSTRHIEDAGYIETKAIIKEVGALYARRKRTLDPRITGQLSQMPQSSLDDIRKWGAAWMKYLNEYDEFEVQP